jgi:RsiW-degrading membrane proteinase PrsW (M82 family)
MALMGFETDPIRRTGPRTLHGLIHDLTFVLFVAALLPAFCFLWRRFREDPAWRGHVRYTLATGMIATPLLLLPGVAYYLFIVVVLVWFEATALRLWYLSCG